MKISGQVKNGQLPKPVMDAIRKTIDGMEGKYVEVEIKPRKRSLAQNKYRWGVVNKTVMDALNKNLQQQGLPLCSTEDADLFIKDKALGIVHRVNTDMGELTVQGRLKRKTAAEFEESMEQIRAFFAEKGVNIPLPHEDELEQWYSENLNR